MPDRLTLYTIISAFWVAFLGILGTNIIVDNAVMPLKSAAPAEGEEQVFAYPIEVPEVADTGGDAGGPVERIDIRPLILAASVDDGKAVFRKCSSCHTVEAGGKNGTGPNLHDVVGAAVGNHADFKYSDSLKAIGGNWTYDKLDQYLENPKKLAPKGTMSFAGLKKPKERADVIKLLIENSPAAPPVEVAPAEAAAPAEAPAQ